MTKKTASELVGYCLDCDPQEYGRHRGQATPVFMKVDVDNGKPRVTLGCHAEKRGYMDKCCKLAKERDRRRAVKEKALGRFETHIHPWHVLRPEDVKVLYPELLEKPAESTGKDSIFDKARRAVEEKERLAFSKGEDSSKKRMMGIQPADKETRKKKKKSSRKTQKRPQRSVWNMEQRLGELQRMNAEKR